MRQWYLKEIPDRFKKTLLNEQFLLHDSGPSPQSSCVEDTDSEEEQKEEAGPGVIVFTTRKNIEILCQSSIRFVHDTFKTAPSIFAQIFTRLLVYENVQVILKRWLRYYWSMHSCQETRLSSTKQFWKWLKMLLNDSI